MATLFMSHSLIKSMFHQLFSIFKLFSILSLQMSYEAQILQNNFLDQCKALLPPTWPSVLSHPLDMLCPALLRTQTSEPSFLAFCPGFHQSSLLASTMLFLLRLPPPKRGYIVSCLGPLTTGFTRLQGGVHSV